MYLIQSSDKLKEIIDMDNLYCQKREAKVFIFNRLIFHPFQLHLFYAPAIVKLKCLFGYLTKKRIPSRSLKDWLYLKFGKQVCQYFLIPYNEKVWRTDLNNISLNWVSRVSAGTLKFLKGLSLKGDKNYNSNEYVCYPSEGGFENLFSTSIKKLNDYIKLNTEVIKIDLENKIAIVKDGKIYRYNKVVSTIPIDILVTKLINSRKDKIIKLVNKLEKVSTCIVTFLTRKQQTNLQRVYIPEKKYLAHRVIINSNSNKSFRQKNESIFSLEISYKDKGDLPSENIIVNNCKKLLRDLDIVKEDDDIREYKIDFFEYMYPTQIINLDSIILEVQKYLKNYNCYTVGRFGSWNYANIDGILNEIIHLINHNF